MDGDIFLGFDCLVEPIRVSATWEDTSSMLIDDHDFIVAYEIVDILAIYCGCLQGILHMMEIVEVLADIDIVYTKILLDFTDTCLCEGGSFLLFIDLVISLSLQ